MLKLKAIKKDYVTASETVKALRGVDISFRKKEFVSILGPSGCGKTTLLNIIGGLDHYTDGDLVINGRSTKSYNDRDWDVYRNHRVGFIFQSYNLIPHQTVLGNVELALTIAGIGKDERIERAKRALDKVGLSGQYYKRPNQLSGGQCQRVAIARALVNDPEILLADEPTGALDTVTSVQIMDLIREIAGERLVIMVTHNPELAEQYSTRIVRLLDGEIVEDTNPMSVEEELEEERIERDERIEKEKSFKARKKRRREKAKMSFFTAFKLSARNLISKKGRTTMVGIAGSIGIIGIAMVLAFSAGIKGYVASMQDDMLSGNPITITDTTYDLEALTGMMSQEQKEEIIKEPGRVYINSIVEYLMKMDKDLNSIIIKNDISENYVNYVKAMPKEYYAAMLLDYGIDMTNNIYTGFVGEGEDEEKEISISALTEIYTALLEKTDFKDYAAYVNAIVPSFKQLPDSTDYISEQYDITGELADEKGEVVLVLNKDDELADVLLARLGYYTQEEFINLIYKAAEDPNYNAELSHGQYFTNEELLNKVFTWYPNDTVYTKNTDPMMSAMRPFTYTHLGSELDKDGAIELKVVGILSAKDTVSFGSLSSGIYYTKALTDHVLTNSAESEIVKNLIDTEQDAYQSMTVNGMSIGIVYNFDYTYLGESFTESAFVGSALGIEDMIGGMAGGGAGSGGAGGAGGTGGSGGGSMGNMSTLSAMRMLSLRALGGNDLADDISIYPLSFESKDLVTEYLDKWNGDGDVTLGDTTLTAEERGSVTYTDALSLVINLINNMIDIVSYALIAFTSISLVVSTVMIGIITYVSVVERIKEIGVIRSLGGRKKDVSHLFNAETFIIGLLAGVIGVGFTYFASVIVNLILKPLIGYPSIAALPVSNAIILILLSIGLTLISGLIPASSAAKKDPVVALRTE